MTESVKIDKDIYISLHGSPKIFLTEAVEYRDKSIQNKKIYGTSDIKRNISYMYYLGLMTKTAMDYPVLIRPLKIHIKYMSNIFYYINNVFTNSIIDAYNDSKLESFRIALLHEDKLMKKIINGIYDGEITSRELSMLFNRNIITPEELLEYIDSNAQDILTKTLEYNVIDPHSIKKLLRESEYRFSDESIFKDYIDKITLDQI